MDPAPSGLLATVAQTNNNKTRRTFMNDEGNPLLDSFLAYRQQLLRYIGRIVRPHEIEDIVQETFVQSFTASRLQPIRNPRAFMFRTARNLALNSINRAEHKLACSIEIVDEGEFWSDGDPVEDKYESDQRFQSFCKAVSMLPDTCRKAFVLKKVYGMSQKEIAIHMGIAGSTVEKHIAKGMSATAAYLQQIGQMPSVETCTQRFADQLDDFNPGQEQTS
jgi:RNA polymerase sigma factor (sigma-70 family)